MKNILKNKFINVQLFAGDEQEGVTEVSSTEAYAEKQDTSNKQASEKTVSKELFDKTSNELSRLKKQIKDLEDKDKTEEQKKQDLIAELEQTRLQKQQAIDELILNFNKKIVANEIVELKKFLVGKDTDKALDDFATHLVDANEAKTQERLVSFKAILRSAYESGLEQVKKGAWDNMAKQNTSGSKEQKSEFALFQEKSKTQQSNEIVEF